MASVDDPNALLIYQVGPVRCCAPTNPIEQIVPPPHLTHPPGSDAARPGIFKYGERIVSVIDLRQRFGVDPQRWQPGRLVITALQRGYTAFWVDRIVDVIGTPTGGWGHLPPHLPRDAFSRTLLHDDHIHLYTEFEQLPNLHPAGFLREYLAHLEQQTASADRAHPVSERPLDDDEPARSTAVSRAEPAGSRDDTPPESLSPASSPAPATDPPRAGTPDNTVSRTTASSAGHTPVRPVTAAFKQSPASPGHTGLPGPAAAPRPTPPLKSPGSHTAAPRPAPSSTPPPGNSAAMPPTAPPAAPTSRDSAADSGTWPALLFLLLLVTCAAGGSYLYFSAEEPPLLTSAPDPAPTTLPAPLTRTPGPLPEVPSAPAAATPQNSPPVTQTPGPVPAPEAEPEPEPAPPPPAAETTTEAPPYRASIERDAEGITLIIEEPAPPLPQETVPAPTLPPALAETPLADAAGIAEPVSPQSDPPPAPAPEPKPAPKPPVADKREIVHIVRRGDTLWDIAKRYVDNPWRYPELAEHSEIRDPDLIYPGDRVRIIIYRGRRP